MKKLFRMLILSLFILSPIQANALMCSNEQKVQYQEMAKNISVNYEYVESNDDVTFSIKISNIPQGFIIVDYNADKAYNYNGSEIVIPNVEKNKSYKFVVMKEGIPCSWTKFYTHYITIPSYNKYYKDEICEGIEDYKLCSKWLNTNYSYEEWKNEVNKYINSLNKEIVEEKTEEVKGLFDQILDFYLEYYMYILPSIIVLCIFGVYLYNKKHDLF